jgi:hypothetical protein
VIDDVKLAVCVDERVCEELCGFVVVPMSCDKVELRVSVDFEYVLDKVLSVNVVVMVAVRELEPVGCHVREMVGDRVGLRDSFRTLVYVREPDGVPDGVGLDLEAVSEAVAERVDVSDTVLVGC